MENAEELKEKAKDIFNKYIAYKENYDVIKSEAANKYIYHSGDYNLEFSINNYKYERSRDMKELMMDYLQFPNETMQKVFKEYISNEEKEERLYSRVSGINDIELTVKEKIGVRLLEKELEEKLILEFKNNPNNEYKKKYDIIDSIKDLDAQMVTINICHNGKEKSFKYPKNQIYNFYFSDYYIPEVCKRNEIKELYSDTRFYSDYALEDIKSISFRKQILYEDKQLIQLNNAKEERDIVDEMFD